MNNLTLIAQLEALLFLSGEPVAFQKIAKLLNVSRKEVLQARDDLQTTLRENPLSGLMLIEHDEKLELATKGEYAPLGEKLIESVHEEKLSRAAFEVLAIVAYKAPITRAEIESIRGVNCSFTLRTLLLRGLIERHENPDDVREYLYQPTFALLERLGVGSVRELPDFQSLTEDERLTLVTAAEPVSQNINDESTT